MRSMGALSGAVCLFPLYRWEGGEGENERESARRGDSFRSRGASDRRWTLSTAARRDDTTMAGCCCIALEIVSDERIRWCMIFLVSFFLNGI